MEYCAGSQDQESKDRHRPAAEKHSNSHGSDHKWDSRAKQLDGDARTL